MHYEVDSCRRLFVVRCTKFGPLEDFEANANPASLSERSAVKGSAVACRGGNQSALLPAKREGIGPGAWTGARRPAPEAISSQRNPCVRRMPFYAQ